MKRRIAQAGPRWKASGRKSRHDAGPRVPRALIGSRWARARCVQVERSSTLTIRRSCSRRSTTFSPAPASSIRIDSSPWFSCTFVVTPASASAFCRPRCQIPGRGLEPRPPRHLHFRCRSVAPGIPDSRRRAPASRASVSAVSTPDHATMRVPAHCPSPCRLMASDAPPTAALSRTTFVARRRDLREVRHDPTGAAAAPKNHRQIRHSQRQQNAG